MSSIVKVSHIYPYKTSDVWQALTTPRVMKDWCLQTNFSLKKKRTFHLRDTSRKRDLLIDCKILDFEDNKFLIYTWGEGSHYPTIVKFTLTEVPEGTEVVLEHGPFEGIPGFFAKRNFTGVWKKMLIQKLPASLEKFKYKKIK